jgi:acetyl esterase/lipase
MLTAQAVSWFQSHGLPRPGAIGVFGSGAVRFRMGDSAYIAAYLDGRAPPPPAIDPGMAIPYFAGADQNDPLIAPASHPEVIARFPPTLLISGTRAMDLSQVVVTNTELLKAGVESQVIIGEGMDHCYINNPELPESRDAYAIITRFFDTHLGRRAR